MQLVICYSEWEECFDNCRDYYCPNPRPQVIGGGGGGSNQCGGASGGAGVGGGGDGLGLGLGGGGDGLGFGGSGTGSGLGSGVDAGSGAVTDNHSDLALSDVIPLNLVRAYRPNDSASYGFGIGMSFNYDIFVVGDATTYEALVLADGAMVNYPRVSGTNYTDGVFENASTPGALFASKITWNGSGWTLRLRTGVVLTFAEAALTSITDRNGNTVRVVRNSSGFPTAILSPNGRWISFTYDSSNRIVQAQDNAGRTVSYMYNSGGRLASFTDAGGGVTSYAYDGSGRLSSVTNPRGNLVASLQYDSNNRSTQLTHADGGVYNFSYALDGNGNVSTADMLDPRGFTCHMTFSSNGYILSDTWAQGHPEQESENYTRDASSNLLLSETDTLGRITSYSYDSLGNLTSLTRLAGTPQAATTSFIYDSTFNQLTSVTDPLNHTWTLSRDNHGNLTGFNDPLSHPVTAGYTAEGQLSSLTDGAGNTTQIAYDGGDPASLTDALGNITTLFTDPVGNIDLVVDPLGNETSYSYSPVNELASITDTKGGVTSFSYDTDRDLLGVTDANGRVTSYSYDDMDHRISRTDPLNHPETYSYDLSGNLVSHTDRNGNLTKYQYDGLNRPTFAGFGYNGSTYQSTVSYTWDGGDRITQAVDSIAGTIARTYDGLDQLTEEQTPLSDITYAYDSARRRTSTTVAGQNTVSYTWDNANRLTGITQGSNSVGFAYDAANRRTSLTLPNGIALAYSYDQNSRATGMTWTLGSNQVGNLGYSYDADGRVTAKIGSFARTNLPQAVAGNTFNAANETTGFNGTALSYDLNGNLIGDGTNSYSWDARNHLMGITGSSTANFVYDAFGRRMSKNITGSVTNFVYDGSNPVQELDGANPPNITGNLLTGLNIDEYFTRTDSSGAMNLLTDNLGSALALADTNGTIQTQYNYEPFGKASASGAISGNTYQFTGRENDGTGLYFNRARYYSPTLHRFISPDPIRIAGGINLYEYTFNDPATLSDPLGLDAYLCRRSIQLTNHISVWQVGKLYHQYICIVKDVRSPIPICFGLTAEGWDWLHTPGLWENDAFRDSCQLESTKSCVDNCLLEKLAGPPPEYSINNKRGMNCHASSNSDMQECQFECSAVLEGQNP